MTPAQVRALARTTESSTVEFKQNVRDTTAAARLLAAFANAHGGTLLVGIGDEGTLVGVRDGERIQALLERGANTVVPPVTVVIDIVDVDGKNIVVAKIDKGNQLHLVDGEVLRRVGTRTALVPTPPLELVAAVLDDDSTSAAVLKAILQEKNHVKSVDVFTSAATDGLLGALVDGKFNCVFIDVFTVGVDRAVQFIQQVRRDSPVVDFCLYSRANELATLPGVTEDWRSRFGHYFRLPKDRSIDVIDALADEIIYLLASDIQSAVARTKITNLLWV